ncbi:MAG: PAS domain-containing sensor histidine kinase, partial [Acidobacteriales bacterium]|nr:PAS domain-containing sensor histidine kinase [Terriglobales bacterium]
RIQDRLAAVGRLASAVAHEIRNPLTSIAGSAHMLVSIPALADEHRQLFRIIVRESERLNQILSEFLDYSRERQYNFTPTDLVCLLEETLTLLPNRSAAPQRGVVITTDLSVPVAPTFADGDKLRQVIWNLCDNALRAMPQGGELRVALQRDSDFWVITVADSGRGISPESIENIFEPFQSGFPGGTGLGLAIVYQIVQAHSGHIAVLSAPGQGTEFTLHLRCLDPGEIPAAAPALAAATH